MFDGQDSSELEDWFKVKVELSNFIYQPKNHHKHRFSKVVYTLTPARELTQPWL